MQEAEAELASARARHEAASAMLKTFQQAGEGRAADGVRMELRAPIDGVLNSQLAGPGDVVQAGQALFSVMDPSVVWVEAGIPEASVARLSQARAAYIEGAGDDQSPIPVTGDGRGRFLSLGLEVDVATRTVPLLYETRNPDGQLRISQNVTLQVETSRVESAVAVPERALVEEGELLIAYVQLSGETFEKRVIRAGIRDKGFVQVLEGLREGERVVSKGAVALRLASMSGVIPAHGHAH
jgi:RND family efflux transporter MFP subunit